MMPFISFWAVLGFEGMMPFKSGKFTIYRSHRLLSCLNAATHKETPSSNTRSERRQKNPTWICACSRRHPAVPTSSVSKGCSSCQKLQGRLTEPDRQRSEFWAVVPVHSPAGQAAWHGSSNTTAGLVKAQFKVMPELLQPPPTAVSSRHSSD